MKELQIWYQVSIDNTFSGELASNVAYRERHSTQHNTARLMPLVTLACTEDTRNAMNKTPFLTEHSCMVYTMNDVYAVCKFHKQKHSFPSISTWIQEKSLQQVSGAHQSRKIFDTGQYYIMMS